MSLHPVIWWPLILPVAALLIAFPAWRLIVDARHRRRWALRLATSQAVIIALIGPAVTGGIARQAASDVSVYFVVDTTTSSMARDYQGDQPRIEGMREDIAKIQEEMPGARFSLITFDYASRVVMPLTSDTNALQTATQNMQVEDALYSGGSSVTAAQDRLRATLQGEKKRNPQRARIVFYLGDGEQTAKEAPKPFAMGDLIDGGAVLGYGTKEGGQMATTRADGSTGDDVTDAQGQPGVSTIDEDQLQKIAEQLDLPYTHREGGSIEPAMDEADPGKITDGAGSEIETYTSIVWVFALLAAIGLLIDLYLITREIGRLRRAKT